MPSGQYGNVIRQVGSLFHEGTAAGLPDVALLERFTGHDGEGAEAAFAVLVGWHGPMVLRVCRAIVCKRPAKATLDRSVVIFRTNPKDGFSCEPMPPPRLQPDLPSRQESGRMGDVLIDRVAVDGINRGRCPAGYAASLLLRRAPDSERSPALRGKHERANVPANPT